MQTLTRRHVIVTLTSSSVLLCPALLNAQVVDFEWDEDPDDSMPVGQDQTIEVAAGPAEVEISALMPGDVAVIARPTEDEDYANTGMVQYIAVMHRTDAQMAQGDSPAAGVDPRYLVANLVCPHRGNAIGMTGIPDMPFACTKTGSRHEGRFNAAGMGVAGATEGDPMTVPDYEIEVGDSVVLRLS